jgi:osmotically-inducible protein OsmY
MTRPARLLSLALFAASLPLLQGCFPVVATGVGATALMVTDRRSSGTYVDDEGIEWKASLQIRERLGEKAHINVTSFNRMVLLTGEAFDEASKAEAEKLARGLGNVREVTNEVVIAPSSSIGSRSNDTYLTSKVKTRMVDNGKFSPNHVKVVTEAGTAFLMGMVTRAEADAATEIARTTSGVQRVVRVFEFIGDDQARQLDSLPQQQAPAPAGGKS